MLLSAAVEDGSRSSRRRPKPIKNRQCTTRLDERRTAGAENRTCEPFQPRPRRPPAFSDHGFFSNQVTLTVPVQVAHAPPFKATERLEAYSYNDTSPRTARSPARRLLKEQFAWFVLRKDRGKWRPTSRQLEGAAETPVFGFRRSTRNSPAGPRLVIAFRLRLPRAGLLSGLS